VLTGLKNKKMPRPDIVHMIKRHWSYIMEAVSRVWRMYLLGCKGFSMVTDHATLVHLLKQSSDKLKDKQTHWVEKFILYANLMRMLYMK
jgi:hypothetical protein